jgi:PAS domain S-box-containing protein
MNLKYYIIGGLALYALQALLSLLIAGLLRQKHSRRSAEESLWKKTEEVDQFFNVSLDLLCIANTDAFFLRLNPAWEKILGYSIEELMAKRFLDFVHPDDLLRTQEAVSSLSSQQKVIYFKNRYRSKDGTYRWLEWSAAPAGNLIYAAARDVTERKLAEGTLEERLQFERLLSETSARFLNIRPDRVDSEIESGLRQILEFLRVDRCGLLQALPDKTSWQVTHLVVEEGVLPVPQGTILPVSIHPWAYDKLIRKREVLSFSRLDDLPAEAIVDRQTWIEWGIRSGLQIPINIGAPVDYVFVINSVKSERVWPEAFIPRLRLLGELLVTAMERKRERLQIEERLRFEGLISNLSGAFVNLPSDEIESQINRNLRSIAEFFDAARCGIGLFSEDRTQLVRAFDYHSAGAEPAPESLSKEQLPWYVEQLIRGKPVVMNRVEDLPPEAEKERKFCLASGMKSILSIPMASGGRILGFFAIVSAREERVWPAELVHRFRLVSEIFTNALERRRAEGEAFHARRELLRLERLSRMGELTASLAHELNQPLTAILANARAALRFLQSDRPDIGEVKEILQEIADDDKRAGEIIRNLRSLFKKEEGDRETVAIIPMLGEALRLLNGEAITRRLQIETEFADLLPQVSVNKTHFQQVVINLIMNAAESMSDASQDRRITIRTQQCDNGFVQVAVCDRGSGVDERDLSRIFAPFFSKKRSGLGLGLSLSRSIIEAHGGHIWASNNPDRGATFFFDLPGVIGRQEISNQGISDAR